MLDFFKNMFQTKDVGKELAGAKTYCVPNSILSAWTWGAKNKTPVRIAVQKIEEGKDHSQAEALINDKWTPLTEVWNQKGYMEIMPHKRHYDVEPYRYLDLKDWIDEQIQYTKE